MATNPMMDKPAPPMPTGDDESTEPADKITVCIEVDADGSISVGQQPPEGGEDDASSPDGMQDLSQPGSDDESYMRPVKSIDEALRMARMMLQQAMPQGAVMGKPGAPGEQDAANNAFASRRGPKAPQGY